MSLSRCLMVVAVAKEFDILIIFSYIFEGFGVYTAY